MTSFVTHFECSETGERHDAGQLLNLSRAGAPLITRYDLEGVKASVSKQDIASRPADMWRYRELLPLPDGVEIVSLGEVMTPLLPLSGSVETAGEVLVKDESRLPTASFKARGLALAVTMANSFGVKRIAMPTNGNAGAALAAYGARAGIETFVFCPEETPEINVRETAMLGARVWRVNGQIDVCGHIVAEGRDEAGWFDLSTLKEPYRLEGKKTMGLELAEQLGWTLPDAIFYPTGGGTGLIGMWKGFKELKELGWISGPLPKMVVVQSTGCAPVLKALEDGRDDCEPWLSAATLVNGVRVPKAFADKLILSTVRESGGFAVAVSDEAVIAARDRAARMDGVLLSPEGAATLAAWEQSVGESRIARDARSVLFNSGSAHKEPMPPVSERIDVSQPLDFGTVIAK